jgi:D-beta-D-heptose 7-phosphate kinase / D-beta-D-heptose 1-phosphate adenosyltransferase
MIFSLQDDDEIEAMKSLVARARAQGKTVGLASGCFDLIHFHHVQLVQRCRRNCGMLIVGVDSDELVRHDKNESRPVMPDYRRLIMINECKSVGLAFIMNSVDEFAAVAELVKPDIIFKNQAFKGRENEILGREHAKRVMIIQDQIDHSSTTSIIEHLSRKPQAPQTQSVA